MSSKFSFFKDSIRLDFKQLMGVTSLMPPVLFGNRPNPVCSEGARGVK